FIYIVGSDNQVIYHPDKLKINKKNSVKEIAQIISNKDNLSKKITGSINYNLDGKEYTGCYTSVPALKSLVVLSVEVNELKSEANTAGKIIIVSAVLMILIVVLLIYIVINRVFKPLKGLIKNTEEMSHGNLKVTSNIEENNEFGQLSSSFNKMSENIKSMILSLKKVVSELTFLSDTIKSSQDSTESSMKNIAVSSELISSHNMRMSEAVGNSSESFKRIVAKTEEIKTQSVMMTQKTNDIKKVNYRGLETVNTLKKVNFDTAQKLSVVNKSFKQLFENLSDINGIAGLVTSISKQTHILALNASIEAARAGEAGRGFNVVATQIKGLSLSISEQMSRIEELVRKIDANIMNTDEDLKEVNKSAGEEAKAVQETIENYNVVLKAAEEIISAISNVNNSINILDSENQNVNEVLNRVSSLSDEFSESLGEINTVIRSQYDNTRVMAELVERLEASTEDINSNMNKFTV
ncbi:MAG: methyl-accepting chemotaxis protein, partial [Bacillota bacterium]|nr:methyl-accepting chemotaxis protein [Bacillota bacterium]